MRAFACSISTAAVVLGPYATQILGDYGAEIVKVESPSGDLMRLNGVSKNRGMSSIFLTLNRNKRSLALDLQTPEGAEVLRRLIPTADVLVHTMRVEAIERLGFGYAAVSAIHPGIVYCAATGFDQDGPDADRPAFDDIIQAASGLAAVASTGRDAPDYVPSLIADKTAGMAVVNAVLAALLHRARGFGGQYVEVPMLETIAAFVLTEHLGGMAFGASASTTGLCAIVDRRAQAGTDTGRLHRHAALFGAALARLLRSGWAAGNRRGAGLGRPCAVHAQRQQRQALRRRAGDHADADDGGVDGDLPRARYPGDADLYARPIAGTSAAESRRPVPDGGASKRRRGALCAAGDEIRGLSGVHPAATRRRMASTPTKFCARPATTTPRIAALHDRNIVIQKE